MRAKMRALVLVGLAVVLAAPAVTAMAAPVDVDRGVDRAAEWSDLLSFDRVHQLLLAWFGDGGESADTGPAAVQEVADPGSPAHVSGASDNDGGNSGPHWDPNG